MDVHDELWNQLHTMVYNHSEHTSLIAIISGNDFIVTSNLQYTIVR